MDMEAIILASLRLVLTEEVGTQNLPQLESDSSFQKLGIDSLAFSILVARLENELGFDPFVTMEDAVYPETLGHFISIYTNH